MRAAKWSNFERLNGNAAECLMTGYSSLIGLRKVSRRKLLPPARKVTNTPLRRTNTPDQGGGMGAVCFVSRFRRRRLTHSQLAVARSAVTHIRRASRRSRPVISVREIATPQMLSTGPKGTRKASTFECSLRSRIKEAHIAAYK